jgi:hypothetical protein
MLLEARSLPKSAIFKKIPQCQSVSRPAITVLANFGSVLTIVYFVLNSMYTRRTTPVVTGPQPPVHV